MQSEAIAASSFFSIPFLSLLKPQIHITIPLTVKTRNHFILQALSSSSPAKDVWRRPGTTRFHRPKAPQNPTFLDHSVDMDELLASISKTQNENDLFILLSPYKTRQLSIRFMVSLLSREKDWQRSLALLDWINEEARYSPSLFAYNVVIRNVVKAKEWAVAHGLFEEMREKGLTPDRFTYSTLITYFGKEGMFDLALSWLQKMENDGVSGDLVLFSNLIELSRKLRDYSKAISIFNKLKRSGIVRDLVCYNSMINVFGKAKLFREARLLVKEMREIGVMPDTVSYSTMLNMFVENSKFVREFDKADAVYKEMQEEGCVYPDEVHFQMLSLYGARKDFKMIETVFEKLDSDPNVNKKELHLVVASIYERGNRLNDASEIMNRMNERGILS
ncbi:hypothetical protein GOBAR_AA03447 [Gossypium barbadense]|uniref:Pentacotripeptide-repeat region of PRORP domain-containing protein n=1 Tax=Gossypium barbadense TaxID=3634 RepID=A0A2P5YNE4_GOSBA|nr:hypothetical protein GOBAR_AA03447 [Gossypium barbadense]